MPALLLSANNVDGVNDIIGAGRGGESMGTEPTPPVLALIYVSRRIHAKPVSFTVARTVTDSPASMSLYVRFESAFKGV